MSELIPNLNDLRAHLPTDEIVLDAHEFLGELAKAESSAEVAARVDALVDRWIKGSDEHSA